MFNDLQARVTCERCARVDPFVNGVLFVNELQHSVDVSTTLYLACDFLVVLGNRQHERFIFTC